MLSECVSEEAVTILVDAACELCDRQLLGRQSCRKDNSPYDESILLLQPWSHHRAHVEMLRHMELGIS